MAKPKLMSLAPWFGSKRQLAPRIIELLGDHKSYWEPFCGSCAVALTKENVSKTVVNDLHGGLINLARVIAGDKSPELFERFNQTLFCEELYFDSVAWLNENAIGGRELEYAYHYFVACWQGRNGFAGATNELKSGFCKRYTSNGGDPATRFRNVISNIPDWWEKMRHWQILSEDAFALLERIEDKEGVAIYVDPPYFDKSAKYVHDFNDAKHDELAAVLCRFRKTRVVLSYYESPRLHSLYPCWSFVRPQVSKNLAVVAGQSRSAPEVLLVNQAA